MTVYKRIPMTTLKPIPFRFDADEHVYYVMNKPVPNISAMLQKTGHVDPRYYTDEVRERGRAVHSLTADVDLGAIDVAKLVSPFRGWVLAHVKAMKRLKPVHLEIEVPDVHPWYRFGGRPDRVSKVFGVLSVLDEKSGEIEKWHAIQTALQAILKGWRHGLAPEAIQRMTLYLRDDGSFKNKTHDKRRDFDEAYEILRTCC